MRVPITLDLHISNFTYPDVGPDKLFDKIVQIATTAENSGFSSVSAMDHLHQIAPVGAPQNFMLDGSTILAGIAARTQKLTLGLLVGSVTYRNPAHAAKITTTVDVISGGRAWHGIGAGWFEEEHKAYGFDFPGLGQRLAMEEEAIQIHRSLFTKDQTTFHGKYFQVENAYNNPKPVRGDIPILIGGSGEQKTLGMVAKYGDGCNLFGDADNAKRLLGVLAGHCEKLGRNYDDIQKTGMMQIAIADTHEKAQAKLEILRRRGTAEQAIANTVVGTPDTIGEEAQKRRDAGLQGLTVGVPDNYDTETVEQVGKLLAPIFS
ncbi:MAG: TIGR03560 family F420-dependent LLM class oxidoreductase [Solirubrobacterales bacterium]|nr:TIGR03560 family F420-dependent LLM class oxidoreductase [Solirubrobacterales bacterium]